MKCILRNNQRILPAIVVLLGYFFPAVCFAGGLNKFEKGIFDLELIGLKVSSVENDMELFLNWKLDDKSEWKIPARKAVKDLDAIKSSLSKFILPEKLNPLKAELGRIIDQMKEVYGGIDLKSDEEIGKGLNILRGEVGDYTRKFSAYVEANLKLSALPDDFDIGKTEASFVRDDGKGIFERIVELMRMKKYARAYDKLKVLLVKYKGSVFEGSIVSRIIDCRQKGNIQFKDGFDTESSIKLLNDFIMSGNYSPKLYRIFEQWRTLKQSFYNGESNLSVIPNQEYINKRWKAAQNVEKYLENNPDDIWAKRQIVMLMRLPIIRRGGSFGNTNLQYWTMLFGNP